tara:strand:+ start:67 stop:516 length:450 start_codon:yes stop_codon:yes gene_type:complete
MNDELKENIIEYAGFWKRVAAALIDSLVMLIPSMILGFIIGFVMALNDPYVTDYELEIVINIMSVVTWWLYSAVFESSNFMATPGKMALGIVVTDYQNQKISFAQASGRHFGKIISGIIIGIGFIMAAFTEKKQGLHDIMSGTLIVNKK